MVAVGHCGAVLCWWFACAHSVPRLRTFVKFSSASLVHLVIVAGKQERLLLSADNDCKLVKHPTSSGSSVSRFELRFKCDKWINGVRIFEGSRRQHVSSCGGGVHVSVQEDEEGTLSFQASVPVVLVLTILSRMRP